MNLLYCGAPSGTFMSPSALSGDPRVDSADRSFAIPGPGRAAAALFFALVTALDVAAAPMTLQSPSRLLGPVGATLQQPCAPQLGACDQVAGSVELEPVLPGSSFDAYVRQLVEAVGARDGHDHHAGAPLAWALASTRLDAPGGRTLRELALVSATQEPDRSLVDTVSTFVQQVPEPGVALLGLGAVAVLLRRRTQGTQRA